MTPAHCFSDRLTEIFNDTEKLVLNGEYDSNLYSSLHQYNPSILIYDRLLTKEGNVTVDNLDCILKAKKFSKNGLTCLLNMASFKRPGGGVRRGAKAQEEELCRRSNLIFGLPQEHYPLSIIDFIYTKDVTFFKDKDYKICDDFKTDVVTIAAMNLNKDDGISKPDNYLDIMEEKITSMIVYPYLRGCKNLVLSAFGCGVFKNDPNIVASLFDKILFDKSYRKLYDNVSFAIINDKNSVSDNYSIFKNILEK